MRLLAIDTPVWLNNPDGTETEYFVQENQPDQAEEAGVYYRLRERRGIENLDVFMTGIDLDARIQDRTARTIGETEKG